MLHVLIGQDDFSIRQALAAIKKGIGDVTALMTNTTALDGKTVTLEQLCAAAETVPFLSEKRLVIVEGLLERFEPSNKDTKKKTTPKVDKAEEARTFAAALKRLPPFTELVIIWAQDKERREPKAGKERINPLLKELSSITKVKSFPLLKGADLTRWIGNRVAEAGGSISPGALSLLARFVGNDLWTLSGEVDKLALYAAGRRIEEADVKETVNSAQEANIFSMVDAALESRAGAAQQLLQQSFKDGSAPAQILAMLARQMRIIFLVKDMRARGVGRGEIQNKLGLNQEFVLNKAWAQADKYSPARIREAYHKLLEADLAIKTGGYDDPQIALNIFVAELGQSGAATKNR